MRVRVRAGAVETNRGPLLAGCSRAGDHQEANGSTQKPNDGSSISEDADTWWSFLFRSKVTRHSTINTLLRKKSVK